MQQNTVILTQIFKDLIERLIPFLILAIVVELYTYRAVKIAFENKTVPKLIYLITTITIIGIIVYQAFNLKLSAGQTFGFQLMVGLFVLLYLPKFFVFVPVFFQDVVNGFIALFNYTVRPKKVERYFPERRTFVAKAALALAAVPFLGVIHGISLGRFNFHLHLKKIAFGDLPSAFDGLKILQISDLHTGSILSRDRDKIVEAVKLINAQNADLILFTGDLVNNFGDEVDQWIPILNEIKQAPFGNFAVMGNHDYGEYTQWESEVAKRANLEKIKQAYAKIGFHLLLNEHVALEINGASIQLVGVENWGHRFIQLADLPKATKGIDAKDFKILMTHDPSHWEHVIKNDPLHYHLTFSGHTHGMQMGIEVPDLGIKWSPSQYIYKQWAGLYENAGRYLYVNRGLGYHFFPGRIGIWPEITVIELHKKD